MGRKRNGTGKCFYIFIACLVVAVMGGCTVLKDMQAEAENLDTARQLFKRGDYGGAFKEYQEVLNACRNVPPGDEALFYTGLIYAHQGYDKSDCAKSLESFKKLVRVFPKSPFAGQARIWIENLQTRENLTLEVSELNKSLKKSHSEHEKLAKEIEELKRTIRKSRQVDIEIDGKKKELSQ